MAMMVWRVTPTRSASSACVISPWSNRRRRIWLVTRVGLPIGLEAPAVSDQLDRGADERRQNEREIHGVRDPEVIGLGDGQDEWHHHADAQQDAADVLTVSTDVPVADVGGQTLAALVDLVIDAADDLDADAADDRGGDGEADGPQHDRHVVDFRNWRPVGRTKDENDVRGEPDRRDDQIHPLALLFVRHAQLRCTESLTPATV